MPELVNKMLYIDSRTLRTNELLITVTLMYAALTFGISLLSRVVANRMERAYR